MNILREANGIQLNEGNLMSNGLFNVSTDKDVSFWFDGETKDELMEVDDEEFQERCEELIKNSQID